MKYTPEQLADAQAALAAENEGKPWEWQHHISGKWKDGRSGSYKNVGEALFYEEIVRPKPEPKTRPWTRDEVPALPFEVRNKVDGTRSTVVASHGGCCYVGHSTRGFSYNELFENWTSADGSPCGTVE